MRIGKIILCSTIGAFSVTSVFALSSIESKEAIYGDLFYESASLEYTEPTWFQPASLATASTDAEYWIHSVLPFDEDKFEDMYMVIPQLGLITPVVPIPEGTSDFNTFVNGGDSGDIINKYLKGGIIEYPNSVDPGYWGKRIDFGHSNYFKSDDGRYKSVFASLMRLDPGDQVWYFVRNSVGQYDLIRYNVDSSYNTVPSNVGALRRDGDGADALIFGCTHGLDGRWMIEASLIGEPKGKPVPYVDPYASLNSSWRSRVDSAVRKINRLRPNMKKYTIVQIIKRINAIRDQKSMNAAETLLIDYIEEELVRIYPE